MNQSAPSKARYPAITEDTSIVIPVMLVKCATDKAFLFILDMGDGEVREEWFPLSQLLDPDAAKLGDEDIEVAVSEWIFEQKGLFSF